MKLVQKMFVGLSLAGSLMLGSCSKEDVQMPEPEVNVNEHSNLRGIGGEIQVFKPFLAPTYGNAGLDVFPAKWEETGPFGWFEAAAGSSTRTHVMGDPSQPWVTPLPPVPVAPNANSFITIGSSSLPHNLGAPYAVASSSLLNLIVGKKYQITFYVASAAAPYNDGFQVFGATYAKKVLVRDRHNAFHEYIDLTGKEAVWVAKTITFVATKKDHEINFQSEALYAYNKYSFVNIFVDHNSIKMVN